MVKVENNSSCEIVSKGSWPNFIELSSAADTWTLSCGHVAITDFGCPPQYCPTCGKYVTNAYVEGE